MRSAQSQVRDRYPFEQKLRLVGLGSIPFPSHQILFSGAGGAVASSFAAVRNGCARTDIFGFMLTAQSSGRLG
jgi:hypothetical protein